MEAGNTVPPRIKQPKHSAREMFLVTKVSGDEFSAQKILHPLSKKPTKLMSKVYNTKTKTVRLVHSPQKIGSESRTRPVTTDSKKSTPPSPAKTPRRDNMPNRPWSPINDTFYDGCASDDDDDEPVTNVQIQDEGASA